MHEFKIKENCVHEILTCSYCNRVLGGSYKEKPQGTTVDDALEAIERMKARALCPECANHIKESEKNQMRINEWLGTSTTYLFQWKAGITWRL